MKTQSLLLVAMILWAIPTLGQETTENKNVTILSGNITADGSSEVRKEILEECVASISSPATLEAVVESETAYIKGIQGKDGHNDFVQMYQATIEVPYMLHQKELIIITSRTVQKSEPIVRVFDRKVQQRKTFVSNNGNGDMYGGRSKRQYFFSTPEAAATDAKKRARIWIKQQKAVSCKN